MTKDQMKYLREQAAAVRQVADRRINSNKYKFETGELKEPVEVVRARKLIATYREKMEKEWTAERAKLALAYSEVEESIIFGEEKAALAALKKFRAAWID